MDYLIVMFDVGLLVGVVVMFVVFVGGVVCGFLVLGVFVVWFGISVWF